MTTNNESKLSLELAWAKVLLKSCLDVLETHNEPIVKRLRNDVSDFLKDGYNLLKNQKKINISEGNVKEDNIKSGKTKHGDFIVKYLEEGSHYKVKEINVLENVAQRNSQDLTEQWKKGELEQGYYYAEDDGEELIIHIQEKNGSVMGDDFDLKATDWIKPIAPVPSYEDWQELKEFADYSLHNRDELTRQINFWMDKHTQIEAENQKLKELLKECRDFINYEVPDHCIDDVLIDKIDEVLK